MSQIGLDAYWGEFMISPIPMELSLGQCSHGCTFCFATLNKRERYVDYTALLRFFQEFQSRKSLAALLLREGYPVVMSNRTDPFSASVYRQTLPLLKVMTEMGIPVALQTRGGLGIDEALEFIAPSVWYISLITLDEDLARRLEPGAPGPAARLELMRKLVDHGHGVVVGFNPVVDEWQPDPDALLEAAANAGASGAWIERLHLEPRQVKFMNRVRRATLSDELIQRACRRKPEEIDAVAVHNARVAAVELGLEVYSMGQPNYSEFWSIYRDFYWPTFPNWQDFVNACHLADVAGEPIAFEDYWQTVADSFPKGADLPIDSYIGAVAHNVMWETKVPTRMSYRDLLELAWKDPKIRFSPVRSPAFAYAGRQDPDGWRRYVDPKGSPFLVFAGDDEFDGYWAEVDLQQPMREGDGS